MKFYKSNCRTCGVTHYSDSIHATQCLICWKTSKGYELGKADKQLKVLQEQYTKVVAAQGPSSSNDDVDQEAINLLKSTIKRLKMENIRLTSQVTRLEHRLSTANRSSTSNSGKFSQAVLMKMITLCHPDKHNDCEEATEVTKLLLSMRSK